MFKKTVLASLMTASLFASAHVLAEDALTTPVPPAPQLNMNQEMNRLQHMIQVGERNGELTASEIAQLNRTQDRLRLQERDMLKNGMNLAETNRLRTMLREHEHGIMAQRNNGERRQHQHQYQYQHQNATGPVAGQGNLFTGRGNATNRGTGNGGRKSAGGSARGFSFGGSASGFNLGGTSESRGIAGGGAGRSGR